MKRGKRLFVAELLLLAVLFSMNKHTIIAFISIFIHEICHIIVANWKGSQFSKFQVHIYGTRVKLSNLDELLDKDKIKIYIAGPAINLFISGMFFCINFFVDSNIVSEFILINLGLFLFNMIPAYPLDGARILEIILSNKMFYKKVQSIMSQVSYALGLCFIILFFLFILKVGEINLSLLISGILIWYITYSQQKTSTYILMGNIFMKRNKLIRNKYLDNRIISVYYKQGLVNLMSIIDKNRFNTFYVLNDDLKLLFIMHEDELIEALKVYGNISLEEYSKKRLGKSI